MSFDRPDSELSDAADAALLTAFVRQRSEGAFAELVRRHAGWVEGVAKRALGDREAARDAAQEVFIVLARKAGGIRGDALGPWLHRTTVLVCRNAGRREAVRRRALPELYRHIEAMHTPSPDFPALREALPLLDAAVDALPARDRTLVVQRFMENRSWREIGADMGRSEDAARMALRPALERLSALLRKRGIEVPLSAFTALFACASASDASAAALAQHALAKVPAAAAAGRFSPVAWWSAAACLVAGAAAGWTFGTPRQAVAAVAPAIAAETARGKDTAAARAAEEDGGFDLDAVLSALRSLEATGNDPAVVAQLAGALVDMPSDAVAPVVQVLRTRRWGDDTQRVAQACFHRWAQLDIEAAWREVFTPDFLGAATTTVFAVMDALPPGNPERLVAMFNDLPHNTASSSFGFISLHGGQRTIDLLREHLSGLSGAESAPLIARIEKDQWRSFALSAAPKRTSADCAALAPLAAALPPSQTFAIMHIVKSWVELDAAACEAYVKSLPPQTPATNMAVSTYAEFVARRDPAAAAQLISGLPWPAGSFPMQAVAKAWLKSDLEAARRWIEAEPYVPAETRERLIKEAKGIHESSGGNEQ